MSDGLRPVPEGRVKVYANALVREEELTPNRTARPPSKVLAKHLDQILTSIEARAIGNGVTVDWQTLRLEATATTIGPAVLELRAWVRAE